MLSIFDDMVKNFIEVFMEDFFVLGSSFDNYVENLQKVLKRCEYKKLVLNWEKCHFMVTSGIVLGHVISVDGIQVDGIKDFSSISRPFSHLLMNDTPFEWSEKC